LTLTSRQDTDEEYAKKHGAADRRVVYTVLLLLSDGGCTAMQVLGEEENEFTDVAGTGFVFISELWHRTQRASKNTVKLAVFYGYTL